MNIFLAGKMDAENGRWRDALLGTVYDYKAKKQRPRWEVVRTDAIDDVVNDRGGPPSWPKEPNEMVLELHNYVGPYRITWEVDGEKPDSKYSGYFHGVLWRGGHGWMDGRDQNQIVKECREAIWRADFVFAYINSPDCFGTIAEIAIAHEMRKYVHLVVADGAEWNWDDYWYVGALANWVDTDTREVNEPEEVFILRRFKEALVMWTAGAFTRTSLEQRNLALVATGQTGEPKGDLRDFAQSFSQIARWTSDPRVRNEAERMLRRLGVA